MATEIRVPTLGESVTEATVGQWFKKVGDKVSADEPLVELETDKVTVEVPAPSAGVIEAIEAENGSTVTPGALLGTINAQAESKAAPAAGKTVKAVPTGQPTQRTGGQPINAGPEEAAPRGASKPAAAAAVATPAPAARAASENLAPSVRKLVAENNLRPEAIQGTGKGGRITKGDALAVIQGGAAAPAPAPAPAMRAPSAPEDESREERVKMTRLRQTIARRLKDAQNTAAMLTTFNEVDMSNVMALRSRYKDLFEKKHGVKLGFMGFFVKACIQALHDIPAVNAEIDGTDIVYKNYYNIGVAVGTDRGLVVPVLRDADQLGLAEVEKRIGEFGAKARDGQLAIEDMQGGTFTISNGGVYGSLMSTPILNAPQSGILGMHKIQERPVVIGGKIEARPMMYLALSYDHRIVDGKEAVTFLVRVKEAVEDPERLMLDL